MNTKYIELPNPPNEMLFRLDISKPYEICTITYDGTYKSQVFSDNIERFNDYEWFKYTMNNSWKSYLSKTELENYINNKLFEMKFKEEMNESKIIVSINIHD